MQRPVIGVVPLWDESRDSLWMLPGYLEGITEAGGLPLVLPLTTDAAALKQCAGICAGFLFTGGQDLSPSLYGRAVSTLCGPVCGVRDAMEQILFSLAVVERHKSALGICRGIQLFNVLLGGTLYQDIPAEFTKSTLSHRQQPPYNRAVHQVRIEPGSPLHEVFGVEHLGVNSYHHQGIAELAPRLVPMARAEDGLIEGVRMKDHPFAWAVQWHPEMALYEESSRKLFRAFVAASSRASPSYP
ncbi:MAG: gamma-glutamyl-gamma-aminobutyrate hydrolase family protein [Treponema sp.]|nr:gamma-glutamyl-gamma-aminobutyrate hydrolase family protein [Treponema sp.]